MPGSSVKKPRLFYWHRPGKFYLNEYLYTQDWRIPMGIRIENFIQELPLLTDGSLLELARKVHGEIYKRMANKTNTIRLLEEQMEQMYNLRKSEKKMSKKDAVKAFADFLEKR